MKDIEKFRLTCLVNKIETSLFFSIIHMDDWVKSNKNLKDVIECSSNKIRCKLYSVGISNIDIDNLSYDDLNSTLQKFCYIYQDLVNELNRLGESYEQLRNNCEIERRILLVRFEGEYSGFNSLGGLGNEYGKIDWRNRRICWEPEWRAIENLV